MMRSSLLRAAQAAVRGAGGARAPALGRLARPARLPQQLAVSRRWFASSGEKSIEEAREERAAVWEQVHYVKNTNATPRSLMEKAGNLYLVVAGADSLSLKEQTWIRKYNEGLGWPYFDPNQKLDVNECSEQMKAELEKLGIQGDMAKLAAMDIALHALQACAADGLVSSKERAAVSKAVGWWGIESEIALSWAEAFMAGEKVLVDKKMALIASNADGRSTRSGEGYGEGTPTYLSYERLAYMNSNTPLAVEDITKQMACLAAVASVDGLTGLERAWVETYAVYCGGNQPNFEELPAVDSVPGIVAAIATRSGVASHELGAELVYNCIRVGQIDGLSQGEEAAIGHLADELRLKSEFVQQAVALVKDEYEFRGSMFTKMAESAGIDVAKFFAAMQEYGS